MTTDPAPEPSDPCTAHGLSDPVPSNLVLSDLVADAVARWPDDIAWTFAETGERLTFADVQRRSEELADRLAGLGVRRGEPVAVMLRNRPEFPLAWLALAHLGAVLVPVNINYRDLDAGHVLRHCRARVVVTSDEFVALINRLRPGACVEHVLTVDGILTDDATVLTELPRAHREPISVYPEDTANIQYTSGTTGAPKGCELTHQYWTRLAGGLVDGFPRINSADVLLTAQPFHYIDPQWNVVLGLMSGAELVVLDRFHPGSFWAAVREYRVTWFYCLGLMPTLLLRTDASPVDLEHRVRAISCSAIPVGLHRDLEARWAVPWFEAFGMTETGSDVRMNPEDHDATVGTGCLGRAVADREIVVVAPDGAPVPRGTVGEMAIRGVGLMRGYYADPAATAHAFRGGWFHTGDLVRMDSQGLIYYVGRDQDVIRRSGENISAAEVEEALNRHSAVRMAAVVGVADELRGQEVKAYVVLDADVDFDELARFCATQLAYFKVPRYWARREELPMTASERVAKATLTD